MRGDGGGQDVGVEDGEVGIVAVFGLKEVDHRRIEFDGDDAAGLFGQQAGQRAGTGANFEDGIGGGQFGGGDDLGQVVGIGQEVLAQSFTGAEVVLVQ